MQRVPIAHSTVMLILLFKKLQIQILAMLLIAMMFSVDFFTLTQTFNSTFH